MCVGSGWVQGGVGGRGGALGGGLLVNVLKWGFRGVASTKWIEEGRMRKSGEW